MASLTWFTALLVLALSTCEAYRILVIFPVPGKSHGILGAGVVRHLLNAGHKVTAITAFPNLNRHANLTEVVPESNYKIFNEDFINIKAIMDKKLDLSNFNFVQQLMINISMSTIQDENVQKLLQDPTQKFDVVIGEWLFGELYSTLPALYDCPFIWFSTMEPHWLVLRLIDENSNPAYTTHYTTSYVPPYSFTKRIEQLWKQFRGEIVKRQFVAQEKQVYLDFVAPILRKRGKVVPQYETLVYNSSLMLGNSHVSLGSAIRLPQNYKPVGGYHIDLNVKPLPEDLKQILDNAKHGFIFFSMGSNIKSKDIPQSLKEGFLNIFKDLKQVVIWKFEEVLTNLPKNVYILPWADQQSILAHTNCVLFITHGGLLSTTEAIHFGKPIIGVPAFADQFGNVDKAVLKGFARKVDLSYHMVEELKVEIDEVLGNPKYVQKAKEWSFIYHDRPVPPGQELVHWVEHVIKTQGADHLRSVAMLVPWYQKLYLDLLAVIIAILLFTVVVLKVISGRVLLTKQLAEKKKS